MPNTTTGAYPYPASTATPDVPRDIKALAERVDAVLGVHATGVISIPPAAGVTTVAVTFPVGRFPAAPTVMLTVESSNPATAKYHARIHTPATASGFTAGLVAADATTPDITVNVRWHAALMG